MIPGEYHAPGEPTEVADFPEWLTGKERQLK
jgi:hypothetical protein